MKIDKQAIETIRDATELAILLLCLLALVLIGLVGWEAYMWARTLPN